MPMTHGRPHVHIDIDTVLHVDPETQHSGGKGVDGRDVMPVVESNALQRCVLQYRVWLPGQAAAT